MTMAETRDLVVGWPMNHVVAARGQGMCKDCKFLDTTTRETFPYGMVRQGRCSVHPVQPNGKWGDDYCDMTQNPIKEELNEWGKPIEAFVFSAKDEAQKS